MLIPQKTLYGSEIYDLVKKLKISNFRGVLCSDEIPQRSRQRECGIVNFQSHNLPGSHWVAYWKTESDICYYDSYGGLPPIALKKFLKPGWIKRSVVITQRGSTECGGLCIFVLSALSRGLEFGRILEILDERKTATPLNVETKSGQRAFRSATS